MSSFKHGMPQQ